MENCNETEDATKAILAFDTLYTTNHMQMLKLLLPYLECDQQQKLAVFIKWQELLFTMNFFKQYSASLYSTDFQKKKDLNLQTLLPLLSPYCNEREKSILSQFSQMQNMMEMYQNMSEYMPMIQQMMSSMGSSGGNSGSPDSMMDMVKNMMSPEQQDMFSMFMEGGFL